MSSTKSEMISTRDKYIEMVKKELLGPGSEISIPDEEHELITNSPEKNYSIGILFPRDNKINADSDDPDRVEESDPDNDDSFDESEKGDIIEDEQIATNNVSGNITAGEEDNLDEHYKSQLEIYRKALKDLENIDAEIYIYHIEV